MLVTRSLAERRGSPVVGQVDVVYRGPFQGRRIRLILDSIDHLACPVTFTWVDPSSSGDRPAFFEEFIASRPSITGGSYLPGRAKESATVARTLARRRRAGSDLTVAIGFTSLYVAQLLRPRQLVWCINGIPEERLLHQNSRRNRAAVHALWRSARLGHTPDLVVTVSRPMSDLVRSRLPVRAAFELPTAVDRKVFAPSPKAEPPMLSYVGSGAPWQNLPHLGDIWKELAALLPDVRFQVVSRDERARVALDGVPPDRSELVAGHGPEHVAELTAPATYGFVIRKPHLVNEVSFPTKFGEYVATGTEVITTSIGWEIADIVDRTGCGLLVDWRDEPRRIAAAIARHVQERDPADRARACDEAASELDRDRWTAALGQRLTELAR